jgi:hypothetical protein
MVFIYRMGSLLRTSKGSAHLSWNAHESPPAVWWTQHTREVSYGTVQQSHTHTCNTCEQHVTTIVEAKNEVLEQIFSSEICFKLHIINKPNMHNWCQWYYTIKTAAVGSMSSRIYRFYEYICFQQDILYIVSASRFHFELDSLNAVWIRKAN